MPKRLTQEEFIYRARKKHGDKYDYSKVDYKGNKAKVCIICPIHGEFWQTPMGHLRGQGCPHCAGNVKLSTDTFISKAISVHGDKYNYTMAKYDGADKDVCIICPEHGAFWQRPADHLRGHGCPECAKEEVPKKRKRKYDEIIKDCRVVHGDRYEYPRQEIKSVNDKMKIICPIHGPFWQTPHSHISQKSGCIECARQSTRESKFDTKDSFILKARQVHDWKFDYSNVEYKSSDVEVCIICPIHGPFWQKPANHLQGHGCSICKESKGERKISIWMDDNGIEYQRQYRISPEQVLFGRNTFIVDFFVPSLNTIIEFHGEQHYRLCTRFHKTEEQFAIQQDRDRRLREHCKQNKIGLIEIPYTQINEIDKILTRKLLKSNKK